MSNSLTIFLQIQRVASFFFPKHRILFSSHLSKAEVTLRPRKSFFTKHAHLGHLLFYEICPVFFSGFV